MTTATRAQKARLGLFMLVALTILGATLVGMVGTAVFEIRDEYLVRFSGSVSGLDVGSSVLYNGVRTGRVESIRINHDDVSGVEVVISLKAGTPVKADTVAVMQMQGITGLKYIELSGGTNKSALLSPGDEVQSSSSTFDLLTERATSIAAKVDQLVANLVDMTGGETSTRIRSAMDELRGAVADLRTVVADNRTGVTELIAKAGVAADSAVALMGETTDTVKTSRETLRRIGAWVKPEQVSRLVKQVTGAARELEERMSDKELGAMFASLTGLADRSKSTVEHADLALLQAKDDLFRALDQLVEGAEAFAEFAGMLRDDPAALIRGRSQTERELP